VFLDRELERKAEMKLSEETNEEWERRKAFLMGKRFNAVPLYNIKSHFVTIDSAVLHDIMKEISPEFIVSREDFTGENRKTYWKNIFNFKRLRVSEQKLFTGMIETDGVALCVHYRRLKRDRSVPPSAAPVTKDEENKEEDPAMQEVEDNDFVVDEAKHEEKKEAGPATQKVHEDDFVFGADPGNTNFIAVAVPKRAEDGTDGNLRQRDMRLLRFSKARYYRESGMMNERKKFEKWNPGVKDHLEAMSEASSRGANFKAFREFMEVRVAHWDALWKEYSKPM